LMGIRGSFANTGCRSTVRRIADALRRVAKNGLTEPGLRITTSIVFGEHLVCNAPNDIPRDSEIGVVAALASLEHGPSRFFREVGTHFDHVLDAPDNGDLASIG